ncbi:hypothetical protein GC167_07995 [bacterium]|nr:hypothetical protein [bacterium]
MAYTQFNGTDNDRKKEQRKAALISIGVHAVVTVLFVFFGLSYLEPKPEAGIAIAFGNTADAGGAGEIVQESRSNPTSDPTEPEEEMATQDHIETVSVPDKPKKPNPDQPKTETQKPTEPERTPDQRLRDLMKPGGAGTGQGQGIGSGDGKQGSPDGTGDQQGQGGGNGTQGGYSLGGRKPRSLPEPVYDCDAQGRVVVKIRVNQSGKVVYTDPGANIPNGPQSTTTAQCLLDRAKAAALQTTWQSSTEGAEEQAGYIVYNFSKR